MKKVFLIRHAKSDWTNSNKLKDIDRPLSTRGVRNSYTMANRLKENNIIPDSIISSDAVRTLHTTTIFSKVMKTMGKIKIVEELYLCSSDEILKQINIFKAETNVLFLFAHNPSIEDFAYETKVFNNIPTCSILEYSYNENIEKLEYKDFKLLSLDFPKKNVY